MWYYMWPYCSMMASTDTVAIDAVAADILLKKRNASGRQGPIRPEPVHIKRAAELGLGVNDRGAGQLP